MNTTETLKDTHIQPVLKQSPFDLVEITQQTRWILQGIPSLMALIRLSGWQKSDLIIIAARPAMRKNFLYCLWQKNAGFRLLNNQ